MDAGNSLPDNVITALSLNSFKSSLNNYWHRHEFKFRATRNTTGEIVVSNVTRRYSKGSLEVAWRNGALWWITVLKIACDNNNNNNNNNLSL